MLPRWGGGDAGCTGGAAGEVPAVRGGVGSGDNGLVDSGRVDPGRRGRSGGVSGGLGHLAAAVW
ncbi:MAG TPA: hypothetical protein VFQ91_08295 [Bryobacteraceae bacterium]|nr:hypothetical protein [Bryobacteraceae bacterium]